MLLHAALTPVMSATEIPMLMVGFVSSVVALCNWAGHLHQGADLVGKVEQGIPKDDSRNPSVIADLSDPMTTLHRRYSITFLLVLAGLDLSTRWLLFASAVPGAWLHFSLNTG
ncbi:hypothetical protein B5M09_013096, partial [Aphanomyces astaci]